MGRPQTAAAIERYLADAFNLEQVSRIGNSVTGSGFSLYQALSGGKKVFIKWGGKPGSSLNDYTWTQKLHSLHSEFFLQPFFCVDEEKVQCLGLEYYTGRTLKRALLENSLSLEEKKRLVIALPRIAEALIQADCVHRDIKPDNLAILDNGDIKLFDFEFATSASNYREREEILRSPYLMSAVGTKNECGVALGIGRFRWDDIVILLRILRRIGVEEQYAQAYAQAERFLLAQQGRRVICFPGARRLIIKRRTLKLLAVLMPRKAWRDKVRAFYRPASL